jgi:dTDP-4-dehydrorhamnose reductase
LDVKILLFGKDGQVGWALQRSLAPLGELVALGRHSAAGLCGDLTDLDGILATMRQISPDVVVNAAAYTAVDQAESDPVMAARVNAVAPGVLAAEAARSGAIFVHYSTEYVFGGDGVNPWQETDTPSPLNIYGKTKLQGELAIAQADCRHFIFRTSWVYASRGENFGKTILRLACERDSLNVVNDQIGAPTGANLIAEITAHVLSAINPTVPSGIYHLASAGETSWYDYACWVLDYARRHGVALKMTSAAVRPVPSSEFSTPAKRPLNSRLATTKLRTTFNLSLPPWQAGVERMLNEVIHNPLSHTSQSS